MNFHPVDWFRIENEKKNNIYDKKPKVKEYKKNMWKKNKNVKTFAQLIGGMTVYLKFQINW